MRTYIVKHMFKQINKKVIIFALRKFCYVNLYDAHIFFISQKIEELQKENEKMQTALGRLESSVSITFMML